MSSETIDVKKRDALGSRACCKLRQTGRVPANLYGHGEQNLNLSVCRDAIGNIIKHGTKLLNLTGDVSDTAILREVQWDTFGVDVIHVDFARVSTSEAVEVTLPIHLHGEAPGTSEGGQLAFNAHEITIRCPAANIPEHIDVNVGSLHLGQAIHANEVPLPAGATVVTAGSTVVVQCVKPVDTEDMGGASGASEPELIRKEKAAGDEG
ncbi:MAG: 50S ribosomal protein L25 [Planctomycetales bacterium]|nr:50S ribosomal protein L25 [Planctomycetales bacterium]